MGAIRTILKWGIFIIPILLVLLIAAWAVSRAMYPTEKQREAIAQMEQHPDFHGKNAFALLWTLERDVPDDRLDEVVMEDTRRLSQRPPMPGPDDEEAWQFESLAKAYPDLSPTDDDRRLFCRSRTEDCLSQVREDLDTYVALMDRNRTFLDRINKLHNHDYIQFEFPNRLTTPFPAFQSVFPPGTQYALLFAQGRTQEALAATCREMVTWRRLGKNSDSLLSRMIGVASVTDLNGNMLAHMLAELPIDTPLPGPCDQALAPPTVDDISICNAMRGEFGVVASTYRDLSASFDEADFFQRFTSAVIFDAETSLGMTVDNFRSLCSQSEREYLATDRRESLESSIGWSFACIGNPLGCNFFRIPPNYSSYRHRLQDYGVKLRVLGTLAWMRSNATEETSPAELLAARPNEFKSPARDIEFGPDGRTLQISLYEERRGEYWSVPLPPALYSRSK